MNRFAPFLPRRLHPAHLAALAGLLLMTLLWPRPAAPLAPAECEGTRGPVCNMDQVCIPISPTMWFCIPFELRRDGRALR